MSDASPLVAPLLAAGGAAPAMRAGSLLLSREELRDQVLATAGWLHRAGIGPGARVAFALPKGIEALRLLLATLAAGAAYVPLNHRLAPPALAAILADLRPDLLVAPPAAIAGAEARLPGLRHAAAPMAPIERLSGATAALPSPPGLAAILFTSGSTGAPKGIMLSHDNIGVFASWAAREFGLRAADQVASHAPFHFDLSTFDIFAALAQGACLHLLAETDAAFPGAVRRFIGDAAITVWYSVPTALAALQQRDALRGLASLRHILFAGEVFPTPALRRCMHDLPATRFANLFGPTETNVFAFHHLTAPPASDDDPVPIGTPCPHAEVTLSDAGEMLVAGPGVMLGYWQRPDLTAASRVDGRPDSYRTGDHATRRPDGALLFAGRRDHLVKLHGHRVELLGLEAVLQAHPAVAEAVAVVTSDQRLAVFLVERHRVTDDDLRAAVAARLGPAYRPSIFVRLNAMPRSSNGKADRGELRARASGPA